MALLLNIHPAIVFAITTASSIAIFFAMRVLLHTFYARAADRWLFIGRRVEGIRRKGSPLVKKYGFVGLVLFIAIPLPTTGVYGGAVLSWLMGMSWPISLLAIVIGAAASNGMVALSVMGIAQAVA